MTTRRSFLRAGAAAAGALLLPGAVHARRPGAAPAGGDAAPDDHALATVLRRIRPPTFPARRFPVTAHGATGDGAADARPGILAAIAACHEAGGGRVVVPAGTWRVDGPLHLRSGVDLHLEEGATIRFSAEPAHYLPLVLTRWEGTELYNYSPLVYAYQATDVAITGRGTLDGNGKAGFARWKPREGADMDRLRGMGIDGVPVHERVFGEGHFLRPSMVQFWGCQNVLVEDVTIVDSPFWIVHPVYSRNVTMRGVRVRSDNPNNDGVDPDSCTDVLVERCDFHTGDDCIAIKSGRDADGWRVARPSENIVLRDCRMHSDKAALCIGSEMSGGVRNVWLERCRVAGAVTPIYFKTNLDRGGRIEGVRIRDIDVIAADTLIHFTTGYHGYRGGQHPPSVRDIRIERVTCDEAWRAIRAVGVAGAPLRDLTLVDVAVRTARRPNEVRHVAGLALRHVRVNDAPVTLPATIA